MYVYVCVFGNFHEIIEIVGPTHTAPYPYIRYAFMMNSANKKLTNTHGQAVFYKLTTMAIILHTCLHYILRDVLETITRSVAMVL